MSGRYEMGQLVAAGGMADVYEGTDHELNRRVAVKRLRGSVADPSARERFRREAQLLSGFTHPNSVRVYDALEDDDGPYIVMELVDGETLRQRLRRRMRLDVGEAAEIAEQLLAALAAAHARGIVHRDVKPANVLITRDGWVKLADFGIATMQDNTELTMHGQVVGTPKYLSPEQAVGGKATPASDLYAVGVLLFEMVAGRAPFEGETSVATLSAHSRAPVPPLAELRPDVPAWYVAITERALAKDPNLRFPDAASMRDALIAGEHVDETELLAGPVTGATATLAMPTAAVAAAAAPAVADEVTGFSPPSRTGGEPETPERARWFVPVLIALVVLLVSAVALAVLTGGGGGGTPEPSRTETTTPVTITPTVGPTAVAPIVPQISPGQQKKLEDGDNSGKGNNNGNSGKGKSGEG